MAVLTNTGIIATVRSRVGDDNAASYLMTDAVMTDKIDNQAIVKLSGYVKKEVEDTSIVGNGGNNYSLPAGVRKEQIQQMKVRSNSDIKTDQPLNQVEIHHNMIFTPYTLSTATAIVLWYHTPFVVGTDDFPQQVAEFLYKLVEYEWYDYALKKRTDFEQWAAVGRSITSISELRVLKQDVQTELDTLANTWGETMEVRDAGGGA